MISDKSLQLTVNLCWLMKKLLMKLIKVATCSKGGDIIANDSNPEKNKMELKKRSVSMSVNVQQEFHASC